MQTQLGKKMLFCCDNKKNVPNWRWCHAIWDSVATTVHDRAPHHRSGWHSSWLRGVHLSGLRRQTDRQADRVQFKWSSSTVQIPSAHHFTNSGLPPWRRLRMNTSDNAFTTSVHATACLAVTSGRMTRRAAHSKATLKQIREHNNHE